MPRKKRYRVSAEMTISVSTVVEATSEAKALEAALDVPVQSLCHQCSNGADDEWSTSGELDGAPRNLRAEEE